jgi:hypothetical protein
MALTFSIGLISGAQVKFIRRLSGNINLLF